MPPALRPRRPSPGKVETETADDFALQQTTVIKGSTINGLVPVRTPLANISNVEVEIYHVFPLDSANPPSGNVPSRANSPSDVEIASATRDGSAGAWITLPTSGFPASLGSGGCSEASSVLIGV
jgi:hypothetical protein